MGEWKKIDIKFSKIGNAKYYKDDKLMDVDDWYGSPFICPKCKSKIYTMIAEPGRYPACSINNRAYFVAQSLYACLECNKFFVPLGDDLTAETILYKDM